MGRIGFCKKRCDFIPFYGMFLRLLLEFLCVFVEILSDLLIRLALLLKAFWGLFEMLFCFFSRGFWKANPR